MVEYNIWGEPEVERDIWGNRIRKKRSKNKISKIKNISKPVKNKENEIKKDTRRSFGRTIEKRTYDNQEGKCKRCNKPVKVSHMEYHHINFHANGGKSTSDNVMGVCLECHKDIHDEERIKERDNKTKNKENEDIISRLPKVNTPKKKKKRKKHTYMFGVRVD